MNGWLLLPPDTVPAQWRDRAIDVRLIPLLPSEAAALLSGEPADPLVGAADLPLARLVARGLSTDAIARRLDLDPRTVQRRIASLRSRLGARSKAELATLLAERGLRA